MRTKVKPGSGLTLITLRTNVGRVGREEKIMDLNADNVIELASIYNAEDIAAQEFSQEDIENGLPFVQVTTSASGTGRRVRVVAAPYIRLADGMLAGVADPVVAHCDVKRNFVPNKMAAWWAKRSFGSELPVEIVHLV